MSEKPALEPGLAVGEALRAVARDILREARAAIEDPAHSDAVAVHEFRRAMKRWRALLRLLEPFLEDGPPLRTPARAPAGALGGGRRGKAPRRMSSPPTCGCALPTRWRRPTARSSAGRSTH